MSTTSSKINKFSIKFSKNAVKANRIPTTDGNEQNTQKTCEKQSTNDDALTRYNCYDSATYSQKHE